MEQTCFDYFLHAFLLALLTSAARSWHIQNPCAEEQLKWSSADLQTVMRIPALPEALACLHASEAPLDVQQIIAGHSVGSKGLLPTASVFSAKA